MDDQSPTSSNQEIQSAFDFARIEQIKPVNPNELSELVMSNISKSTLNDPVALAQVLQTIWDLESSSGTNLRREKIKAGLVAQYSEIHYPRLDLEA